MSVPWVNELGSGDPVLFIHGGNSVGASWIPLLAPLAADHRLIFPDRPGCGLTAHFNYRGVDLRQPGVEFIRALLDELGEERVAIVGEGAPRLFHRLVGTRGVNNLLYEGPRTHKLAPELPRPDQPTLFLWGDKDPQGAPPSGSRLLP